MTRTRSRWLAAAALVIFLVGAIVVSGVLEPGPIRVVQRERATPSAPAPSIGNPVSKESPARVVASSAPAKSAVCDDFTVWMKLATGQITQGCLAAAQVSQLGTTWRYSFEGDKPWRLEITAVGREIQSLTISSPNGQYACQFERCEGIRIAGPNQSGEKRIVLVSTPVYQPNEAPSPNQQPAARLRADLSTPEAKPICGDDALRVLYDDGTGSSFCATSINTDMAQPQRRVYTFTTLDGDSLVVGVDGGGDIVEVVYDGGAYRCARTECAGVDITAGDNSMDVKGFRFGATTLLRTDEDASRPQTVALYGELTVPSVEF